jgi:hypothetical protein
MHQKRTQDTIAPMPDIVCPDLVELTAIRELPSSGYQYRTLASTSLGNVRFSERCLPENSLLAQTRVYVRQPVIPIAQYEALCSIQQHPSLFSISFIGWSEEDMGNDARSA